MSKIGLSSIAFADNPDEKKLQEGKSLIRKARHNKTRGIRASKS